MRSVICLEDMQVRIEFMKRWLEGTGAQVVWCPTVADFRVALREHANDVKLICLDHDLGDGTPFDKNSETGRHGAAAIADGSRIPVVVWTGSPSAGKAMVGDLTRRGVAARHIYFEHDNFNELKQIALEAVKE